MTSKDFFSSIIGRTISHYRILEKLGSEGAQGSVYKAEDTRLSGRIVALKFISAELIQDRDAAESIRREAEAIAGLSHPNIITLHEFDEFEGWPFFCMQYIEGETLKDRIQKGPIPLGETLQIGAQIASALGYAHDRGILHCDIKPANIMVTPDGSVILTDFGLAEIELRKEVGTEGKTKGTLEYMAPEVIQRQNPSNFSDIYSLGVILYELFTGVRPFRSDHVVALARSIINDRERPIREIRPEVPERLEAIVARTMAKDPINRYERVVDLERDLLRYLSPATEKKPEVLSAPPINKRLRSYFRFALAAVLIAVTVYSVLRMRSSSIERGFEKDAPPSITVLYLKNISGKETDEYFADGLTQDIIDGLSHISSLRVAPTIAVRPFKGKAVEIEEIRRRLGCKYILDGTVQRVPDRVRISVQLVSTETGGQLYSKRYDRRLNIQDIFDIQDDVTQRIISALEVRISAEENRRLRKKSTDSLSAYEYFLLGREKFLKNEKEKAIELFKKAMEADESYSLAQVGLAACYVDMYGRGLKADIHWINDAIDLCKKALSIDPELAEAYHVLAMAYHIGKYDYRKAVEYDRRAIEIRPGYFMAYNTLGNLYRNMGQYENARRMLKKCLEFNPHYDEALRGIGKIYRNQEQYKKALPFFDSAFESDPDDLLNQLYMGWITIDVGKEADGIRILKEIIEKSPHVWWTYAILGRHLLSRRLLEEATPLYHKILDLAPNNSSVLSDVGFFYSLAGNYERAEEMINRAVEIAPDDAMALTVLCSSIYQSGDITRALDLSSELATRFPNEFEVWLARGQLLLVAGLANEAYSHSSELVVQFPENPVALGLFGRVLLRKGEISEVEKLARRMIDEFDESPRGYNLLAAALIRSGRIEEAFSIQDKGLRQAPMDPETLWCSIQVARKAGHSDEAEKWKARYSAMDLDRFIDTAPVGQPWDKLFWLKEGMGLYPSVTPMNHDSSIDLSKSS